ncbi:hypothetical protein SNE510_64750 [Streptomyces sp. NE5-10]|nr:hypothetical protein SNE510_64750 [Streptomyces sp. NE5-10]
MGSAELGRELGDAGGPLLVAGVATASGLGTGYAVLAAVIAAGPLIALARAGRGRTAPGAAGTPTGDGPAT